MSQLILAKLIAAPLMLLLSGCAPGAPPVVAQAPSERDRILAHIEKLGGTATIDERRSERPIVAVDI